jgi:hypothetical protein
MPEVTPDEFRQVIESQLGGTATLAESMRVLVAHHGKPVWEGVVHVFDLAGHRKATRAYAWSSPIEGTTKRRFFTVLHMGGIKSPLDAVRAAIVAENREK